METLRTCNVCGTTDIVTIRQGFNVAQCQACGHVFENPRPTTKDIIAFYSAGDKYDFWLSQEEGRYKTGQNRLKKLQQYIKGGVLLDVGAGIGQFLDAAKTNFQVNGTEVSISAVAIAKEKYGINLRKGEVESMDFGGQTFDVITMFHVLEHVPSPLETVKKCRSLLRNGGLLVVAVPNDIQSLEAKIRSILSWFNIGRFKRRGPFGFKNLALDGSSDEIHLSHFTVSVLKKLMLQNGFEVVDNGLDPYYAVLAQRQISDRATYAIFSWVKKIFRINLYSTIWMVAKRIA